MKVEASSLTVLWWSMTSVVVIGESDKVVDDPPREDDGCAASLNFPIAPLCRSLCYHSGFIG